MKNKKMGFSINEVVINKNKFSIISLNELSEQKVEMAKVKSSVSHFHCSNRFYVGFFYKSIPFETFINEK